MNISEFSNDFQNTNESIAFFIFSLEVKIIINVIKLKLQT